MRNLLELKVEAKDLLMTNPFICSSDLAGVNYELKLVMGLCKGRAAINWMLILRQSILMALERSLKITPPCAMR